MWQLKNENPYYHLYLAAVSASNEGDFPLATWCLQILENKGALYGTGFWKEPAFQKLRNVKLFKVLVRIHHQ